MSIIGSRPCTKTRVGRRAPPIVLAFLLGGLLAVPARAQWNCCAPGTCSTVAYVPPYGYVSGPGPCPVGAYALMQNVVGGVIWGTLAGLLGPFWGPPAAGVDPVVRSTDPYDAGYDAGFVQGAARGRAERYRRGERAGFDTGRRIGSEGGTYADSYGP